MKLEFSGQIFEKSSNIKFHENPSSDSRVVPCGRTDGRTDITKPTVPSRNFANAPKMHHPAIFYKQGHFSRILCMLRVPPTSSPFDFNTQITFAVRCKFWSFHYAVFFSLLLQPPSQMGNTQNAVKLNSPKKRTELSRCLVIYNDTKAYGEWRYSSSHS
jgi:hypothetical protein